MSDGAQVIAIKVDPSEAVHGAAVALAWLVAGGIIQALPTDSGHGRLAHRPGPKAADAVVDPRRRVMDFRKLVTNGMEVEVSRTVSLETGGDEMPEFACPRCKGEIDTDKVFSLLAKLGNLFAPLPKVTCGSCKARSALPDLIVTNGVFANLTFRFWNWWPLKKSFVTALAKKCGGEGVLIHQRL